MEKIMTGLTSITFRKLSVDEIIRLVKKCGLDGIEWGSDIHVPAGDTQTAKIVQEKTVGAGLKVLSYGSYFHAGEYENPTQEIEKVLESAQALGAPTIRIWAGKQGSAVAKTSYREKVVSQISLACEMAKKIGIKIATEYHRNSLTDSLESTKLLFSQVNNTNMFTYWQPNPDINFDEQLHEIDHLKEKICTYHVFSWEKGNIRLPLSDLRAQWEEYCKKISPDTINMIIEFVKDDSTEQFEADAKALLELTKL